MSKLGTLLDIASLGLDIGQHIELQKIKEQQASMAMNQLNEAVHKAIVESARNELFKLKRVAEKAQGIAGQNRKVAAGTFKLLSLQLEDMGISPDLFPEIRDKEYCIEVTDLINVNLSQYMSALSVDDAQEAINAAKSALRLPDYTYYLEKEAIVREYRDALSIVENKKLKKRYGGLRNKMRYSELNRKLTRGASFLFGAVPVLLAFTGSSSFRGVSLIFALIAVGFAVAFWKLYESNRNRYLDYTQSVNTVDSISEKVDLDQFQFIEKQIPDHLDEVKAVKSHDEQIVETFFYLLDGTAQLN